MQIPRQSTSPAFTRLPLDFGGRFKQPPLSFGSASQANDPAPKPASFLRRHGPKALPLLGVLYFFHGTIWNWLRPDEPTRNPLIVQVASDSDETMSIDLGPLTDRSTIPTDKGVGLIQQGDVSAIRLVADPNLTTTPFYELDVKDDPRYFLVFDPTPAEQAQIEKAGLEAGVSPNVVSAAKSSLVGQIANRFGTPVGLVSIVVTGGVAFLVFNRKRLPGHARRQLEQLSAQRAVPPEAEMPGSSDPAS